ncbi:Mal regulon transcriptional regulator MalI [Salmonella enterica subsp. enterica serovar Choleraesuis]|nr:Mal regulon transcriptional regulator MalI [Salmonella enterica subsp. enterica serovar Choleraesuis]
MSHSKKVTINDVALLAGVSVSTVSLVLSGKGRISANTGQRVNAAIEELGFVRNRQAAALRGGQSGSIGLVVNDIGHPFYAGLVAGVSEVMEREGRLLLLAQSGNTLEQMQRCLTTLNNQGVDGVIIAGSARRLAGIAALTEELALPVVVASRAGDSELADSIRPDHQQAARVLTRHLIECGHQRIAWLGGSADSLTRAERLGGFCATLLQYGLPFHSDWVIECDNSHRQAAEALGALLRHNPTISAVVCHNATIATGAWLGLLRAGRQGGERSMESYFDRQLALGAFAEVGETALDDIPVSWVTTPAREMGARVAERIMERVANGAVAPLGQVLTPRLYPWRG